MAMNNLGINININFTGAGAAQQGAQQAATALNQVAVAGTAAANSTGKLKTQFQQLSGEFVKMVVGKHLIGVFAELAMKTDEITMGMANIRTVMTDSFSPEQANKLKATIMDVGETTGKSFKDIATVTKELISQGLSPEQAQSLLGPLMKFSTVGDISVAKATDLTVALTNMGIAAKDAGQAYDIMLNLANKTTIRAPEFVDIMTKVAPAAVVTHESFIELAASAALLRKSFSSGKEEATALAQTLYTFERTKIQDKVRKAFGVELVANKSTGALKPLLQIIQEINTAMLKGKGGPSALYDIFGTRSGARVLTGGIATLREGMDIGGQNRTGQDLIDVTRSTATKSGGAVDIAFSQKMQALTPQIERLKVAFDDLAGTIGVTLADSLQSAVGSLTDLITNFRVFLVENPRLAEGLGFVAAHLAKIGAVVGVFAVMSGGMAIARSALGPLMAGFVSFRGLLTSTGSVVGALGMGLKGLFRTVLGPLSLILLLVDIVPKIFSLFDIGSVSAIESAKVADGLKETSLSNAKAADSLNSAAEALEAASAEYSNLVVQYGKMMLKKFPVLNTDILNGGAQLGAAQTSEIFKVNPIYAKSLVDSLQKVFTEAKAGDISTGTISTATRSLTIMGSALAAAVEKGVPGAKKAQDQFEKLADNFGTMTSPQAIQFFKDIATLQEGRDPTKEGSPMFAEHKKAVHLTVHSSGMQWANKMEEDYWTNQANRFKPQASGLPNQIQRTADNQHALKNNAPAHAPNTHHRHSGTKVIHTELKIGNEQAIPGTLKVLENHEDVESLSSP